MKAITFKGIQSLAYEDIPDPGLLDSTDVIIRVTAAGICGSDLHPYFGREQGLDCETVMGHELLGEVPQSSEISILIILAGSERKPDTVWGVFGSRCCLGTSYRADFTTDDHSVEVLMPWIQSTNFDAD